MTDVSYVRPRPFPRSAAATATGADSRHADEAAARLHARRDTRPLYGNEPEYNFFSANLRVAAALAERSYDLRPVVGDRGHSPNQAGAIIPDALRWLWRG